MFSLEFVYVLSKFFKSIRYTDFANFDFVSTKFGKFNVRPNTMDSICVSTAFERLDINYLLDQINSIGISSKSIFLDIGGDVGLYSVAVGNYVKSKDFDLRIYAFEPFSKSFKLLNSNIEINKLEMIVKVFNTALSSQVSTSKLYLNPVDFGSNTLTVKKNVDKSLYEEVEIKTLDYYIANKQIDLTGVKNIFIKMDIEGFEVNAMQGSKFLENLKDIDVYILVEDFVDMAIVDYLEEHNYTFITKLTPYNSFWVKNM